MNSMSFFSFPYLKQNLKKSKAALSLMFLVLPILTSIILFMIGADSNISVLGLGDISTVAVLGMYILPIAVSLSLFSFVFKKKSVDFMGSMPLDRKTIFFTNTIGGIFLFLILLLGTTGLMMLATVLLPNLYIPMQAFLDFFVVFFTSYVFVFTACNIAISLAGNAITSIVVAMLIIFFVPFHHYVFSEIYWNSHYAPIYYDALEEAQNCAEDDEVCLEKASYVPTLSPVKENPGYTMPFEIFIDTFDNNIDSLNYQDDVIGKMVLLSILYICIGYLLFEKKEMEVCETSFKKFYWHQLVKILTLIPIFIVVSVSLETAEAVTWILVAAIILVYNFVYDLITKHAIDHVFLNLCCYVFVFIAVTSTMISFLRAEHIFIEEKFTRDDIEKVQIDISNLSFVESTWIPLEEEAVITKIVNFLDPKDMQVSSPIHVMFTVNGKQYKEYIYVDQETAKEVIQSLKKTKAYQEASLENCLEHSEVITIGHDYMLLDKEGKELLKRSLKAGKDAVNGFYVPIDIYTYQNHRLNSYMVHSSIDEALQKYVVEQYNKKARSISFDKNVNIHFRNETGTEEYGVLDTRNNVQLLNIILQTKTIDFSKPMYRVDIYSGNKNVSYYTNITEEMLPFLRVMSTGDTTYVD